MKKLLAILSAALIILSASACSKNTTPAAETTASETETTIVLYSENKKAFSGATLVNTSDDTNIYYLLENGTYKESYAGNILSGTWEIEDDRLVLTMDTGNKKNLTKYYYEIEKNDDGNITGISQYEGRSFTIKEYSIPDKIEATPTKAAETTKAATTKATTKVTTTKAAS